MSLFQDLLPKSGSTLAGRYRIVDTIDSGAFGIVYRARQINLEQDVALKVLLPHVLGDIDVIERFEREVQLAKELKHPNTIRILDCAQTDRGLPYYVMELIDGRSLATLLHEEGRMSPERVRHIATQVLKSLGEAHEQSVVHRDLKPDNIMMTALHAEPDFVKVLDFGIAKSLAARDSSRTDTGVVMGTPSYMAPEQVHGDRATDGRADLYALGLIMAECLSGTVVIRGDDPISTMMTQSSDEPVKLPQAVSHCGLRAVIERAVEKRADARFESAGAMRAALAALGELRDTPITDLMFHDSGAFSDTEPELRPLPSTPAAIATRPRRGALAVLGAIVLLAGLWGAFALGVQQGESRVDGDRNGADTTQSATPTEMSQAAAEQPRDESESELATVRALERELAGLRATVSGEGVVARAVTIGDLVVAASAVAEAEPERGSRRRGDESATAIEEADQPAIPTVLIAPPD